MTESNIVKIIKKVCEQLDAKKAEEIKLLDVREQSSITDYIIIATGTSEPHLKALRDEIEKILDTEKVELLGSEYQPNSGWAVVDGFVFMVHLFLKEQRESYALESLWKDALVVDYNTL